MLADGAVEEAKRWLDRGLTGLRIFTGGSTKDVDASSLDDRAAYPVWELMNERGLPICVQTDVSGIPAMMSLAKRAGAISAGAIQRSLVMQVVQAELLSTRWES